MALCEGPRVEPRTCPRRCAPAPPDPLAGTRAARAALEDMERTHILAALAQNGGNRTRTAGELGIGPATLYRKLKAYGQVQDA